MKLDANVANLSYYLQRRFNKCAIIQLPRISMETCIVIRKLCVQIEQKKKTYGKAANTENKYDGFDILEAFTYKRIVLKRDIFNCLLLPDINLTSSNS